MSHCATAVADLLPFRPLEPIGMSENYSHKHQQDDDDDFGEIPVPVELFDLDIEDLFDFNEAEHNESNDPQESSVQTAYNYPTIFQDLTLDDRDLFTLPTISDSSPEGAIGDKFVEENASSLEKALTDAVGDALSSCFQEQYISDDMFIETLLTCSEGIPPENDYIEIPSTSHMKSTRSVSTRRVNLSPQGTRVVRDTYVETTPKVFTTLDTVNNSDSSVTHTSKKRTNSCLLLTNHSLKRPALDLTQGMTDGRGDDYEDEKGLSDRTSQNTPSVEGTQEQKTTAQARLHELEEDEVGFSS